MTVFSGLYSDVGGPEIVCGCCGEIATLGCLACLCALHSERCACHCQDETKRKTAPLRPQAVVA